MCTYARLHVEGSDYKTRLTPKFHRRPDCRAADPRVLRAIIPGTIMDVLVSPGQAVARDEPLLVLQAMKMHNPVAATRAGRVAEIHVQAGQVVAKGDPLVSLDWNEPTVH